MQLIKCGKLGGENVEKYEFYRAEQAKQERPSFPQSFHNENGLHKILKLLHIGGTFPLVCSRCTVGLTRGFVILCVGGWVFVLHKVQ